MLFAGCPVPLDWGLSPVLGVPVQEFPLSSGVAGALFRVFASAYSGPFPFS